MIETSDDRTAEGIAVDDIDLSFVPRPLETVTIRGFGDEALLIDETTGGIHMLNAVSSVVWQCFDGTVTLGTLVDELATAFAAPSEVVREDVLLLTRTLASIGLLDGIAPPSVEAFRPASGVDVGEPLEDFRLPGLDRDDLSLSDLRGRPVVLVNWSPSCGYCGRIARDLRAMQPALEDAGTGLALLTAGEPDANRALLAEHDLSLPVMLRHDAGDFADPFPSMGTPVAYLLDAEGRVAAPLAYGANEVVDLVREAAGLPEPEVDEEHRYLAGGSSGVCATGTEAPGKPRTWVSTVAYEVDGLRIGVRTDSAAAEELVDRFLAAHRVGVDPNAPANYSVVLPAASQTGSRELGLLLWADATAIRSRSPRRILMGLAAYLSSHVKAPEDGLLRTENLAVVGDGRALLLPSVSTLWLEKLQPRLARLGLAVVDEPWAIIDPEALELVVPEPALTLDRSVLDALEEPRSTRSELPRVDPGRYPLRAWGMWSTEEEIPSRAQLVTAGLSTVATDRGQLLAVTERLDTLFDRLPPLPLSPERADKLADQVERHLSLAG